MTSVIRFLVLYQCSCYVGLAPQYHHGITPPHASFRYVLPLQKELFSGAIPWYCHGFQCSYSTCNELTNILFLSLAAAGTPSNKDERKRSSSASASNKNKTPKMKGATPKIRTRLSTGTLVMNGTSTVALGDGKAQTASASEKTPAKPSKEATPKTVKGGC